MPSEEEMKFFGILVLKGRLKKEDVLKCLQASEALSRKGYSLSLGEVAVKLKLLTEEQLDLYQRSGGDELPPMPGYELIAKVGEGGTSNVYHFKESKTGNDWAVKILKEDQAAIDSVRNSFLREANLLIKLDHENIVKGNRVGTVKGRYVFIMEYIEGDDLNDLVRKGMIFNEDAALYIVLQAGKALEYMRTQNILHRDIKPGNIMLKKDNMVKLIDLGFATVMGADAGPSDSTLGTVQFISPEQARGQGDLDIRSDIYSLGVTLYQLAVGTLPFSGEDDQEIMTKQILESLSSPALKDRAKISPHMHYFIEKMMAKEREIRYQGPLELTEDIENTIRGKKTLTFRPGREGMDDEEFLDTPYDDEEEKKGERGDKESDDESGRGKARKKGKKPGSKFFRRWGKS
ncbi:MAG: serine/threonine protein kinase [Planctomycetota bacterium]|jgi:serine/threonine-protein kinase